MASSHAKGRDGSGTPQSGGSSIVELSHAFPDDQPTVLGGLRPTPLPEAILAGQTLGHYELLTAIGAGGMATVLKARDSDLDRLVALKILPPETARDPDALIRFKQEARAAALLNHDHIARVYHCGEDRGLHFIAFEYVEGDNLRTILDRDGRLTPEQAVRYMLHVANGLQHAAERGVVHRDIKPSNILIAPGGQAKIVDMGLARTFESGGVTQSGVTLGTFDYISPEQALDPRQADTRSDIYSLGCTFYHALTGRPPVPEGTAAQKLQAHQNAAPVDPRDCNAAVPESLAAVLARMMAKDPSRRYAFVSELIADLHGVAAQCGMPIDAPSRASGAPRPESSVISAQLPVLFAILLALIVVVTILLVAGGSKSPAPVPPWSDAPPGSPVTVSEVGSIGKSSGGESTAKPVRTAEQLVEAMRLSESPQIRLSPGIVYDLTALPEGVVFRGSHLVVEADPSADPHSPPPVLRVAAVGLDAGPRPGSLTFRQCRLVTIRGLDFQLVQSRSARDDMNHETAALFADQVSRLQISGCRFRGDLGFGAGLTIRADASSHADFQHCLFDCGGPASGCQLRGQVRGEFTDCAFAPHAAAISLPISEAEAVPEVHLNECTFLLDRGAALQAAGPAQIMAGFCLFASGENRPDEAGMPGRPPAIRPAVLRLDTDTASVSFRGRPEHPNGYYGTAAVMISDRPVPAGSMVVQFDDPLARMLTRNPWASSDPKAVLAGSDPALAFRLSLNDARLRLPPASGVVLLGVKSVGMGESRIYSGPWPPERARAVRAAANERVLWPEAESEDATERLYPTFAAAFAALKSGETLSIAVHGNVAVPLLAESSIVATIRPAAGFTPTLIPDAPGIPTDAPLFRLVNGKLTFENLAIHLQDRQAIASVTGHSTCDFRRCVLTIQQRDRSSIAAVIVSEPMRQPGEPPAIAFIDTILRGTGTAVSASGARAFTLRCDNAAIALDGNLLVIESTGKIESAWKCQVTLKNSTVVFDDPLIRLIAPNGEIPSLTVDAETSLFGPLAGQTSSPPLLRIESTDAADPLHRVIWSGRSNLFAFGESATAVEWIHAGEGRDRYRDWSQWLRSTRDDGKLLSRFRFARGALKPKLDRVVGTDFAPSIATPAAAGASIERLPEMP